MVIFLNEFQEHIIMENGHIKLIIPLIVEFVLFDQLSDG